MLLPAIDRNKYQLESIHLGETPDRIAEAESAGVQSVPALTLVGAAIADLKQ